MRGKGDCEETGNVIKRITPAYAGKSRWHCQIKILCQDHPRLCGEKSIEGQRRVCEEGSPPPMRGKAVRCGEFASYSGITPAYAGKRRTSSILLPAV